MSKIVAYEACPKCRANGRDSRGDNLAIYDDGGAHCFACKHHVFPKYYIPRKVEPNVPKSLRPADFTREVPADALKWLLQYGLPWSYWKETIGFSPQERRLVFDVGNPLQFSIGRYIEQSNGFSGNQTFRQERRVHVDGTPGSDGSRRDEDSSSLRLRAAGEGPSNKVRKWFVWGDSHKHCEVVGQGTSIVLVEDLISAHKVAQAGACAVPLFGTKIHPCHLYYLINERMPIVLWLDKDQELNVKKQAWQLESVINRQVKVVTTNKDPKELSFEDIRNVC